MKFQVSEADIKAAKFPHELFLINLIFNHILIFVAVLSASSLQQYVVIVPVVSVAILAYTFWRGHRSLKTDPWFAKCHWQIAVRRSRIFLIMLGLMGLAIVILLLVSGGDLRPQHYAFGGAAMLPTMVTVLVLIVMESDALHQAKQGIVSDKLVERFPDHGLQVIS